MTEEMIKKDAVHTDSKCECITVRPVADVTDEKDGVEICFEVPLMISLWKSKINF